MKQKTKNRHADRLSDLPDEMLPHILSHLPSDEAVRSSVLSRRWRDVHKAVPVVDLVDHKEGRRGYDVKVCFDQQVTGAILSKPPGTPIRTLRLQAFYQPQELLDQWISSAMSSSAEEIDLNLRYWHTSRKSICPFASSPGDFDKYYKDAYVKTHHQLFRCPTLRRLRLTNWKLDLPLGKVTSSLETLCLARIMDPNGVLQQLISSCPRLADLTLQECPSLTQITVTSPHLQSFAIICCHQAQRVQLDSHCLKSLHYKGGIPQNSIFKLANYTGVVALTIEICEDLSGKEQKEVAPVTTLISQCTDLTYLHLSLRPSMAFNSLFRGDVRRLSRLTQLGLQGCLRNEDDVRSVVVFLCDTQNLEVLSLFPLGPQVPKKTQYLSDSESDDELIQDDGIDYSSRVTRSFWPMHIRCLDDKLRRINIGKYRGLQLQKILARFLLSRTASLEELSVALTAGCSRREHARELRSWKSNCHTRVAVTICQ
ncbi:FBD-associated F-box protein At5g60610-like [Lolium perenne]|uniref:FBD-associated F-box protein At5g60610-like n=1 Tax=Lolium perenne TaxID=4522 RepID=UPI0021EA3D59|nr:putative FBD-associated F-box protein At5g56700 [Lolium perenne]